MRFSVKLILAMVLLNLWFVNCANSGQDVHAATTKVDYSIPDMIPSTLLPTMAVGVDACYVFLRPDGDSAFFGPLAKTEEVRRIDREGSWILVWIPRLRITGWVRKQQVYTVNKESSDEETIPTKYLSILNIIKKRVNIRRSASTRSPIIFKARQRQEFLLLDEKKGWYQIWIPHLGKKGWVADKMAVKQHRR